ncbi:hypothetical protein [Duganella violaceipulchra]|uniref:Methionine/alanine import family NSS transporter small subunit n=1 Tax=Duganella violaceipulchra TaxID=2849652 RepID=A0ABT1GM32_9BURK|nr:hypothetical protein [Duganella violaceicalia]MCP2010041.1 hypothetical protein [Duganella violaceicalia]
MNLIHAIVTVIAMIVGLGVSIWVFLETGKPHSESKAEDDQS